MKTEIDIQQKIIETRDYLDNNVCTLFETGEINAVISILEWVLRDKKVSRRCLENEIKI